MKKRKIEYSLTAKQRKEMQNRSYVAPPTEEELIAAEEAKAAKAEKNSMIKRIAFISIACLLSVCLIITAIALPFIIPEKVKGNPIAVFMLKDGSVIEMELYKDDAPAAVASFIYLATNGFYNNTIFHDITNGFVSFNGYTAPTKHKSDDVKFVSKLKGFSEHTVNESGESRFKLGYRLKQENENAVINEKGLMVFMAGQGTWGTSTGFMFSASENPQLSFPGNSSATHFTVMGRYLGEKSLEVIERISAMTEIEYSVVNSFKHPVDYESVKIKSVRIINIEKKYKEKILKNFENYIDKELDMRQSWATEAFSYSDTPINPTPPPSEPDTADPENTPSEP